LSVIVLNWNGKHLLKECLDSLLSQTYRNFEIVLVDNGSEDGSVRFLEDNYGGRITLVRSERNLGFAAGNNLGIKHSKGKFIALLNNDTSADSHWLESLIAFMESNKGAGMVGSKILNYYRKNEIDNTGHLLFPDGLNRGRGRLDTDLGQFDNSTEILFPSGCAALYSRKMLNDISGFDEEFFLYGDDADIGIHGRLLGYNAVYCPHAVVFHKYSETAGSYSEIKAFYVERNRIWLLFKYLPWDYILMSPLYTLQRYAYQAYGIMRNTGAASRFAKTGGLGKIPKVVLLSHLSALMGLPRVIRKRKYIAKTRKISNRDFRDLLKRHTISCREISLKD
jgi:GT2 family glycosyltransferase